MARQWYIRRDESAEVTGPFELHEIRRMVSSGELAADAQVAEPQGGETPAPDYWRPANSVNEFGFPLPEVQVNTKAAEPEVRHVEKLMQVGKWLGVFSVLVFVLSAIAIFTPLVGFAIVTLAMSIVIWGLSYIVLALAQIVWELQQQREGNAEQ